jgi:mRNA interferase MazF
LRRGDVYTAATGAGFGGKPRPVVVIQASSYCAAPVVMVGLLYDETHFIETIRPLILPDRQNGLLKPSVFASNALVAVRESKFGERLGSLAAHDLAVVDNALRIILGLT